MFSATNLRKNEHFNQKTNISFSTANLISTILIASAMKNMFFFFTLTLCMMVSVVNAQNVSRGAAKPTKTSKTAPCIPNYNFSKARSMNELREMQSKGISETAILQKEAAQNELSSQAAPAKQYIRRVGIAANIPGNYVVGKTATPSYNPVLKHAATSNARSMPSQPANIRKTVTNQ